AIPAEQRAALRSACRRIRRPLPPFPLPAPAPGSPRSAQASSAPPGSSCQTFVRFVVGSPSPPLQDVWPRASAVLIVPNQCPPGRGLTHQWSEAIASSSVIRPLAVNRTYRSGVAPDEQDRRDRERQGAVAQEEQPA